MEWYDDYIVHRTETAILWRLANGDRFGPYMVSGFQNGVLGRVNMTAHQAFDWLAGQANVSRTDALFKLGEAEDYIAGGADQCRYSLADAKPS